MSSQPITSSSYTNSNGYDLSSLFNNSQLQVTGLASGLNTNSIIQALVSVQQQPITHLTNQQSGLTATNQQLTTIQTALRQLMANAKTLGSPQLFANAQTVTSNNPSVVSASAPSGVGAVVGGYQVAVTSLASASQRTFTYSSQSSANQVTIDNTPISLAANATAQDFVNAVNSSSADVWATVTDTNTVVLSSRQTGDLGSNFISVQSNPALTQVGTGTKGTDAAGTVNSTPFSSHTDTVTNAIPGVTLTLNGTTGSGGAVGVTVGAPGPSQQSIQTAAQAFVTSYNSVLDQINTQLNQTPSSSDPTKGTLYGDPALRGLLTSMRQAMYAAGAGLPSSMASPLDVGISTGKGFAASAADAIAGHLMVDANALTTALQNNPSGVQQMLKSWSQSFSNAVNAQAGAGGAIDLRIQSDTTRISQLGNQINSMQSALKDKQLQLQKQFAAMEAALSQGQSTSSWLTSQINALPAF